MSYCNRRSCVSFSGCDSVTEAGLCHLGRLSHLQSLDAAYLRGVSDNVLLLLQALPLRQLRLAQDQMGRARLSIEGVVRSVRETETD